MLDVIVVGARCAGAATALLLARQGHRVLVIDQDRFPSDMRLSTHLIWHAGVDLLQKWNVLDAVRASLCPPLTAFSLDLGPVVLKGRPAQANVGAAFAPKRVVLDQILLEAAVAAGAELREGLLFDGVLWDGPRVVGVRVKNPDGSVSEETARWVVGADGRHSAVASAVGSQPYHAFPKEQGSLNTFAYFSGMSLKGAEFVSRPRRLGYAWQTNDDQVLVGMVMPGREARMPRAEVEARFFEELELTSPLLAARVRAGRREGDWISTSINTFCREPSGAGWSLVGDAGLTMDPITMAGITNALRDAESLANALHQGLSGGQELDEAMLGFKDQRDHVSVPFHLFSQEVAALLPVTDNVQRLCRDVAGSQQEIDRYFGMWAQTVPLASFLQA
ncbi:NAD(P)/FAD-dependent oxidoreductase [Aquabacterium sp.]|uniref:NAD(P)/FAD-dependent oxidoreductase n=1 Tax=Aquabacterium sp. TaxID=1872578 RepID=UPI003D6C8B0E